MYDRSSYKDIYDNSKPYNYVVDAFIIIFNVPAITLIVSLFIILLRNKWSNMGIDMKLICLVMCFDFIASSAALISAITNLFNIGQGLSDTVFCSLDAIALDTGFIMSLSMVGILSLERCLVIVYKKKFPPKFYYSIIAAQLVLNCIPIIVSLLMDGFYIMPVSEYCLFDVDNPGGLFGSVLVFLLGGSSLTIILICYGLICWYRRSISQKTQLDLGLDPEKVKREVNRTIFKSLTLVGASLITNGPYITIQIVSWVDINYLTPLADMLSVICITSSCFVNTFILLNMKPDLMKSLKQLWLIN